jgi:hypothetical protein
MQLNELDLLQAGVPVLLGQPALCWAAPLESQDFCDWPLPPMQLLLPSPHAMSLRPHSRELAVEDSTD